MSYSARAGTTSTARATAPPPPPSRLAANSLGTKTEAELRTEAELKSPCRSRP